jgi:DNA polymerase-1
MPETLYLIDGHAHLYAAFFAINQRLTSPAGEPTGAVFGVVRVLLKVLRERQPDHWAVVLDPPGPTFRNQVYADYKAHRKPMPDDLVPQPRRLRQVLEAMDIPTFSVEGFEADDVIGTLTRRARDAGMDVVICSKDKDMGQLLGPGVTLYDVRNDVVIDEKKWIEERGVRPDQVVDYLALMGDASDNIPGAKGIGEKTAAKLISQFGSLDALLARTAELKGKQKENIEAFAPEAALSKKLATICCDAPVTADFAALRPRQADPARIVPLFRELGFASLLNDLVPPGWEARHAVQGGASPVNPDTPFGGLVAELGLTAPSAAAPADADLEFDPAKMGGAAAQPAAKGVYHTVDTPELFEAFLSRLREQTSFAFDTETTGLDAMSADLVGMSFAWTPGEAYYLPLRGPMTDRKLEMQPTLAALRPVLEDAAVRKTGQNIKYDLLVMRSHGVAMTGIDFDPMVAAYCLDPARREFGIDPLCKDFFGYDKIPTEALLGKGRKALNMDEVEVVRVAEYAGEDADFALRLRHELEPQLAPAGVGPLFSDVEMPLVAVLADMEEAGIAVDAQFLAGMSKQLDDKIRLLRDEIVTQAGVDFNPDSTKQLGEVLFGKLGLKRVRKTAGGAAATDVDVLSELADEHPVPGLVLEYRQLTKLKGTYVDALPTLINRRTGRVHTKFNQTGAQTGRLSSSDPNLQNIPVRTELGRSIRRAFTAGKPGHVLLTADYSQIELRLLAHFSGDAALVEAFRSDRDIHRFVAAQVFGVAEDQVTPEMRYKAKAVNFGIIYGQSDWGLARSTGMSVKEAREFIRGYFARYATVKRFIDDCIRLTTVTGVAPTVLGRKRKVEAIHSSNRSMRAFGERLAVNTVLQGSAADLIKVAMVNIHRRLRGENRPGRMLLTIHDELVFEVPEDAVETERAMIAEEMTRALPLTVPLKVDTAWGRTWLEVG